MDSQDLLLLELKYKVSHLVPGYIVCRDSNNISIEVYKEDGTHVGDRVPADVILAMLRAKAGTTARKE